jgi:hypothetical protein
LRRAEIQTRSAKDQTPSVPAATRKTALSPAGTANEPVARTACSTGRVSVRWGGCCASVDEARAADIARKRAVKIFGAIYMAGCARGPRVVEGGKDIPIVHATPSLLTSQSPPHWCSRQV